MVTQADQQAARNILTGLVNQTTLAHLVKQYPKTNGQTFSKSELLDVYLHTHSQPDPAILAILKKKPVRTLSGVTPVTVLTKPYPCPGACIFCPVDVRMPKSYIATEPGAMRAAQNGFDPYLQVAARLQAYREIGHPTGKIELIVLGGTWSVYPETYQIWFIKRLFDALNDFSHGKAHLYPPPSINLTASLPKEQTYNQYIAKTNYPHPQETSTWSELWKVQQANETAASRCVGLVLETRPDYTTDHEVIRMRKLGATKIQVGIQSLDDQVLAKNKRGHTVAQTEIALKLIRQAGFKIHAHWMPNLYGSDPRADKVDYDRLFSNPSICPDELKVYPCSLIEKTELVDLYQRQAWQPYTDSELLDVLSYVLSHTPEYCRLSRVVRDIPSQEILIGNKHTNFRQMAEKVLSATDMHDIRAREIRHQELPASLTLDDVVYKTSVSEEHFLQFITPSRQIAGFFTLIPAHHRSHYP